jgi:hypothetical protein
MNASLRDSEGKLFLSINCGTLSVSDTLPTLLCQVNWGKLLESFQASTTTLLNKTSVALDMIINMEVIAVGGPTS